VYDHFQYDKFHPKGDRIYRITTDAKGHEGPFSEKYATSPLPFKNELAERFSFVQGGSNLNSYFRGEIRSPHKILNIRSLYADEAFFDVFGFELKEGNNDALVEPFSIVLSEELSEKLFPNQSALGQTVEFEDHGNYKVTGVVKSPPGKTHIQLEALGSLSTLPVLVEKDLVSESYNSWKEHWSGYNYLVLSDPSFKNEAEAAINTLASVKIKYEEDEQELIFRLQSMNEIVPGGVTSNEIAFTLPWFVLMFFGLLGLIVLTTASINYTNLSIAKALSRAKEIAIRKVNGASKRQIISQFLTESVMTAFLSLIFAVVIYRFLIVSFNEIWIFNMIGISLEDSLGTYGYFILFTIVLGLLTGIGPAVFLSRIRAVNSLKGNLSKIKSRKRSIFKYLTGKRTLISVQFSLSIIMLVTILILNKQGEFLVNSNYGFNESEVFYINTHKQNPASIKQHFESIPGVENVSFTSHHPAVGRNHARGAQWKKDQEPITLYYFSVDPSYIDVMEIELIAGRNFPEDMTTQNEKFIIINETAVETFGFESASQAIGETLILDTLGLQVIGVAKDYHWEPLMKSIRPLALRVLPDRYEYAYLKVRSEDMVAQKKKFEQAWTSFDVTREYEGGFLNEQLDEFYQFFYDLGNILTYVAMIALSITGLGFLGMVSFELKTKVKEIGIRKVLGATFRSLIFSMGKGFIVMIVITSLIAIPFAMWVNGLWVNQMAFHAPVDFTIFITTITIVATIAAVTILSQVWINANKNPTETLRSE
jgi:putative ABC transport system permease protein